jgi:hypothetical protein
VASKEYTLLDHFNLVGFAATCVGLSRGDIAVLIGILRHADKSGFCYPGITRLTRLSGMSRRNVMRSLKRLEELSFVAIERTFGRVNRYVIDFYRVTSVAPVTSDSPVTPAASLAVVPVTTLAETGDTQGRTSDIRDTKPVPSLSPELSLRTPLVNTLGNTPWVGNENRKRKAAPATEPSGQDDINWIRHKHHLGLISDQERDAQIAELRLR